MVLFFDAKSTAQSFEICEDLQEKVKTANQKCPSSKEEKSLLKTSTNTKKRNKSLLTAGESMKALYKNSENMLARHVLTWKRSNCQYCEWKFCPNGPRRMLTPHFPTKVFFALWKGSHPICFPQMHPVPFQNPNPRKIPLVILIFSQPILHAKGSMRLNVQKLCENVAY